MVSPGAAASTAAWMDWPGRTMMVVAAPEGAGNPRTAAPTATAIATPRAPILLAIAASPHRRSAARRRSPMAAKSHRGLPGHHAPPTGWPHSPPGPGPERDAHTKGLTLAFHRGRRQGVTVGIPETVMTSISLMVTGHLAS